MGVCREMIRMGRRGRRGLGGRRIVPRTEQSRVALTRPFRSTEWHLRNGDMMALGRPMGRA
jgi:hypothetical protein